MKIIFISLLSFFFTAYGFSQTLEEALTNYGNGKTWNGAYINKQPAYTIETGYSTPIINFSGTSNQYTVSENMSLLINPGYPNSATYEITGSSTIKFTFLNGISQGVEDYQTTTFQASFISDDHVVLVWDGSTGDIVDPTFGDGLFDKCVKLCLSNDGAGCFSSDINSGVYPEEDDEDDNIGIEEIDPNAKIISSYNLQGQKITYNEGQMKGQIVIHVFDNGQTIKRFEK